MPKVWGWGLALTVITGILVFVLPAMAVGWVIVNGALFTLLLERTRRESAQTLNQRLDEARKQNTLQERNIAMKSRQLETIVVNLPFPFALMDTQGELVLTNDPFMRFVEKETSPLKYDSPVFHPELRAFIRNAFIKESTLIKAFNLNATDYQAYAVPVFDKARYAGCLLMFLDITQILEGERVQKRFIADASHELKTPLSAILGMIEILNRPDFKDEATRQEFQGQIETEARRMDTIIQDLTVLSRLSAQKVLLSPVRANLYHLIQSAYRPLKPTFEAKGNHFDLQMDESLIVSLDVEKMHQVFTNLFTNALKFTEQGSITVRGSLQSGMCVIEVSDTGVGIAPEDQKYIFDRFYRADPSRHRASGGSGLGLAIVRSYIHAHKGEITVSSTVGQGSTFTIKLPL
jgi:two-component system, OmpR family, phosphate regulon sensor histidine kinase PhoR